MGMFSLEGKNALVVGGGGALGCAMAKGLAENGAKVIISGRKLEALTEALKEIGHDAIAIQGDIMTVEGAKALVEKAVETVGHIDILVNSAGFNIRVPALEYSEADWDAIQNVQLKGVFFTSQAVANHMVEKGIRGKIVNVASINSRVVAVPNIISYVAAKGGVSQMTKAMAVEWSQYGIHINAIAPGYFETELTKPVFEDPVRKAKILAHIPMERLGNPSDLAGLCVLLSSDACGYITGQTIYADGGWTTC